jgi:hypothetical protein
MFRRGSASERQAALAVFGDATFLPDECLSIGGKRSGETAGGEDDGVGAQRAGASRAVVEVSVSEVEIGGEESDFARIESGLEDGNGGQFWGASETFYRQTKSNGVHGLFSW